jgi:hypothetical protein
VWTEDEEFGLYLWTAITTGARRGEVSALRENRFDFARQQVRVSTTYIVRQGNRIEKALKDGEGRVLSLDLLPASCSASASSAAEPTHRPLASRCRKTHSRSRLTRQAARRGIPTR